MFPNARIQLEMFQEKTKETKKNRTLPRRGNESDERYICVGSRYIREEPRDNVNNDYIQSADVTINLYGVSRNQTILSNAGRAIFAAAANTQTT